jgi:dihydropteroate synthase
LVDVDSGVRWVVANTDALVWQAGRFRLSFERPLVMGIVNVTPDSFSGSAFDAAAGCELAERLVGEGADLLDLGGESTRPGARPVSVDEELSRLMPVLDHALTLGVPVSVDTRHAAVMQTVLAAGADVINDVQALTGEGALEAVAAHPRCGVCLMHMQGVPATMQAQPHYHDVVKEVQSFLRKRLQLIVENHVSWDRLCIDPGIGFGKSAEHNLSLLRRQRELLSLGRPLLVGWSRKSTLGHLTGRHDPAQRLAASLAAALAAVRAGANILRVHDVAATHDALAVWRAAEAT